MTSALRIGFLPLVDAALIVAAREEGFAEEEGLSLELVREASWANLRDRLSVGMLDAAQMLAPAAIAATLGLGHLRVPMAAPILLSMNGNSITLSSALFGEMAAAAQNALDGVDAVASAFAAVVKARALRGAEPPVLASVFPFSMHTLLARRILAPRRAAGGRRRSPRRAAAAVHGGEPGQRSDRRLLRGRALERPRGRSGQRRDRRARPRPDR